MTTQTVDRNPFIPTLRTLALRLCILNANNFISLGDLPFLLVQPILQACSAAQLALLENQSPHLREDTQEFWARHVAERFKRSDERHDGEDWRDVYERLKIDEEERLESATARLRAKNGKIKEEKLAKRIVVIDPRKTPVSGIKRTHPFTSKTLGDKLICSAWQSASEKECVDGEGETGYFDCYTELFGFSQVFCDATYWVDKTGWIEDDAGAGDTKRARPC
jgi:hypothetical protein